jgi:hypothetical protein
MVDHDLDAGAWINNERRKRSLMTSQHRIAVATQLFSFDVFILVGEGCASSHHYF